MTFVFLDTNILQWMETQSEALYDNQFDSEEAIDFEERYGSKAMTELKALNYIIWVAQRGSLPIAISIESMKEFLETPDLDKRSRLANWAQEMIDWWEMNRDDVVAHDRDVAKIQSDLLRSGKLSYLPHEGDRQLISEAPALGCDTFLTVDRKSIIRFRKELSELGIDPLSPLMFVEKHRVEMSGA